MPRRADTIPAGGDTSRRHRRPAMQPRCMRGEGFPQENEAPEPHLPSGGPEVHGHDRASGQHHRLHNGRQPGPLLPEILKILVNSKGSCRAHPDVDRMVGLPRQDPGAHHTPLVAPGDHIRHIRLSLHSKGARTPATRAATSLANNTTRCNAKTAIDKGDHVSCEDPQDASQKKTTRRRRPQVSR